MLSERRLLFSITAITLLFSITACGNIQEEASTASQHMLVNGAFEDTNSSMSSIAKDNLQENPADSGSENHNGLDSSLVALYDDPTNPSPFPTIPIQIQGTNSEGTYDIDWSCGWNQYKGAVTDRDDPIKWMMKDKAIEDLVYLRDGDTIQITFPEGTAPEEVKLTEFLLNPDGSKKFRYSADNPGKELEFTLTDGDCTFTLEGNAATFFSSNSEDYKPGNVIKGYYLLCNWGHDECEFAFVIRSDAMSFE
jgi:hypothetical protein